VAWDASGVGAAAGAAGAAGAAAGAAAAVAAVAAAAGAGKHSPLPLHFFIFFSENVNKVSHV
jgi:hypothetical protein